MAAHICGRFYWQNLQRDITDHIKKCSSCRHIKGSHAQKGTKMKLFPSRYPFHIVAIDLVELPHSRSGYKHVLTM